MKCGKIICAAIKTRDGKVYALKPPARHNDIFRWIYEEEPAQTHQTTQGFLTQKGKFLNRIAAAKVAFYFEQVGYLQYRLFSEDLW